jgi:Cu/Ag efflux protein CusF
MRSVVTLATLGVVLLGLAVAATAAEEPKERVQTKTGIVKKVDVDAKQIVVMVTRELTFTVTDSTKIVQGEEAKKLSDVKVDAKVAVEYTREGDTRTAKKISILADK